MKDEVRGRRARFARLGLMCALATAGCGGSGDTDTTASPTAQDGGATDGGGDDGLLAPGAGRIGPDGAVQIRSRPDPSCTRASHVSGNYWLCPTPIRPSMAIGACWSAGGTLVVIGDSDENDFIAGELIEDTYTIGYSDAAGEGTWTWADGTSGGFENWDEDQPGPDDFALIRRENGRWATSIDEERPYICEDWK